MERSAFHHCLCYPAHAVTKIRAETSSGLGGVGCGIVAGKNNELRNPRSVVRDGDKEPLK